MSGTGKRPEGIFHIRKKKAPRRVDREVFHCGERKEERAVERSQ